MSITGEFISLRQSELESYRNDISLFEERLNDLDRTKDPAFFHVHKAWDAISYILTGFSHGHIKKAAPPLSPGVTAYPDWSGTKNIPLFRWPFSVKPASSDGSGSGRLR